jgi:hypothetical protein
MISSQSVMCNKYKCVLPFLHVNSRCKRPLLVCKVTLDPIASCSSYVYGLGWLMIRFALSFTIGRAPG